MAHLWIREPASDWSILTLAADAYALDFVPPHRLRARPAPASGSAPAMLARFAEGEREAWFVLARGHGDAHVNGLPLSLGVRALADRDEIRLAGAEPAFFSTESLACALPFPGGPQPVVCPRCLMTIAAGSEAVQCPR